MLPKFYRTFVFIAFSAIAAQGQNPPPRLTLQEAQALAVKSHPQIQAAQNELGFANQQIVINRAPYYPDVYGVVTGSQGNNLARIGAGDVSASRLFDRFGQNLMTFGIGHMEKRSAIFDEVMKLTGPIAQLQFQKMQRPAEFCFCPLGKSGIRSQRDIAGQNLFALFLESRPKVGGEVGMQPADERQIRPAAKESKVRGLHEIIQPARLHQVLNRHEIAEHPSQSQTGFQMLVG